MELRQKGVNVDTVRQSLEGIDENQSAFIAARKKSRSLAGLKYPVFRKRLGTFLRSRGFSFELIDYIIDRVWNEINSD
jgi:SOS response regulatory protein OraA/RecX